MDPTEWDERYAENAHPWGFEPNRFVREHCERLPVGDAVDVGCGDGRHALWLGRLGWRVTGVDFSRVAIEQAQRRTAQRDVYQALRLSWRVEDVATMRLKDESVDLLLLSYLQLPAAEIADLLVRITPALRARGRVVVVAHDARNLTEGIGGPQDPDVLYDPVVVSQVLVDACGLAIEVARTAERPTDAGTALDCVVRARRADAWTRVD